MLKDNWKELSLKARKIYEDSLHETLKLFPFDEETLKEFQKLPSAIGTSVTDFGAPASSPIEEYKRVLPNKTAEITETDPYDLVQLIKKGKYSCMEVLNAYFHAAIIASKLTNCVYEFLPQESLKVAKYLDDNFDELKDKLPLFGLPFSIKEMIPFVNRSVTHGSLCYLDRVVDYNADIVEILLKSGANAFVRTTNPQSLMMLECESYTHGRTVNPFNSTLTCGGSSGGEGALNGIGGSAIGLGSDIGGSIRCPSAFNGIYGLRLTVGRLPTGDYMSCQMGSEAILSVTGPLTRSLDLLELFTKTIIDSKPWTIDPTLASIEWKPEPKDKEFKIGILSHDGVVAPHPPVKRALNLVKEKLMELDNVEVFEFTPYDHARAQKIITSLYFEDGGADTKNTLLDTGEPMCEQTKWALGNENVKPLTFPEQWKLNIEKQKYRKEYLKYWNQFEADAIIAPVFPGPAAKHRTAKYWGYTSQWNLLDYPVLVFPVTKVDLDLDHPDSEYKPLNDIDEFTYKQYDSAKSFENAPVCLGAVGLRNTEEKLITIGKILRDIN
ncbi:amidase [Hyphopichia burtonii NRRL Y-1933]|uniref:Amidase n=1 Tax=Hyphopichia burtonii NRRL Y-1933 TaxID=984485 RepID=A0A1E4RN03_9ASCO|nr:amidase [Hyphopichia burtonii NRRL Y-1933]ODV68658.1 amidase [Hyphopichia burtonii NRRL Y-1933]